jgi:hypothetical protein
LVIGFAGEISYIYNINDEENVEYGIDNSVREFEIATLGLEQRFIYQFNEEYIYPSASVKKAVHGLYIYMQAEQGLIDLDSTSWGMACRGFLGKIHGFSGI